MGRIHPTAVVSPRSEIHQGVEVGPYAVIEDDVAIGEGTVVSAHAVLKTFTRIGKRCVVGEHAILGGLPQDTRFKGEHSLLELDDEVTVREFATLHRASGDGEKTRVGKGSYVMAYSHVSHNCDLGKGVTLANCVQLAGHVQIGDRAFLGGSTGVHQFVRVGRLAMVGAHSYLTQDMPPFLMGSGHPFRVLGPNIVGLERAGIPPERRSVISRLFRLVYKDPRPRAEALKSLTSDELELPEVVEFLEFIKKSSRGIRLKTQKDL